MTEYRVFNFEGVNQESNNKLVDDIKFQISQIKPKGIYHLELPAGLNESIQAVADRLEFYQSWNEQCHRLEHLKPYKPIAYIHYFDGTIFPVDVHAEGHSHVEDILGHLQSDIEDEEEFTKLQDGTVIKLRKVEKVVNPENGKEFIINQNPNAPKVAWIVDNNWSSHPIEYEQDFDSVESVAEYIKEAISAGKDTIENTAQDGKKYSTDITKAWKVIDYDTQEFWIVNAANEAPDRPTLKEMSSIQLRDWISTFSERVVFAIDEDDMTEEVESDIQALDEAIDELDERYCEADFNSRRLDNVLTTFIQKYGLYEQFNEHIDQLKKDLNDPNDTFEIAKEMFGEDLGEFMKERPWLQADLSIKE